MKSNSSESIILKKLINGDQQAFAELFHIYAGNLLSITRKYMRDEEEAKEVVQETFYRVWKYRQNMDATLSFKAYIITIAKRLIFNRAKKRLHELAYHEYYYKNHFDGINDLEEQLDFKELDHKIQVGIENLPPKRREIFILSRHEGLSNQEIADKLNISVSTVENQMNKALKYLREFITLLLLLINPW